MIISVGMMLVALYIFGAVLRLHPLPDYDHDALIIDGPGALDRDMDILGDLFRRINPEIRYRTRTSFVLAYLLIVVLTAYVIMPAHELLHH
jgi:hypothetical protein